MQYGHVPVGARGDDEGGRHFSSLHAVQRHMVDTNQVLSSPLVWKAVVIRSFCPVALCVQPVREWVVSVILLNLRSVTIIKERQHEHKRC